MQQAKRICYSTRRARSSCVSVSALGRNLAGEGLGHDLAVPHDERVRTYLVHVVGSLRGPQNVGIVALDGLLLHAECCARFAKLRQQRLEQRPHRGGSPERSVRREQDGTRRIVREDAHEVALTKTLYVVVENVFRGSHYSLLLCWCWWLASAIGVRCAVSFVAIAAEPVKADCCSPSSPPGEGSGCLWSAQRPALTCVVPSAARATSGSMQSWAASSGDALSHPALSMVALDPLVGFRRSDSNRRGDPIACPRAGYTRRDRYLVAAGAPRVAQAHS